MPGAPHWPGDVLAHCVVAGSVRPQPTPDPPQPTIATVNHRQQRQESRYPISLSGMTGGDVREYRQGVEHITSTMRNHRSGLHVVQIGSDATVFRRDAPSDTLERQQRYAGILGEMRPGSHLTFLVTNAPPEAEQITDGALTLIPLPSGAAGWWALTHALRKVDQQDRVSVVTSQTPFVDGWISQHFGRRRGVPTVAQIHYDIYAPEALGAGLQRAKHLAMLAACRHRLGGFAAIRVVSHEQIAGCRDWAPAARIEVIPVPITMTAGSRDSLSLRRGASPTVLFVGRLVDQKNLPRWFNVAARVAAVVPSARFILAGEGPARRSAEVLAQRIGIGSNTRFLGDVCYDDLAGLYGTGSVLLLTSDYEGFGRVIVEASMFGMPVVATDVLGPRELIEDGETGYLREPTDEAGLADAVIRLLQDQELRQQMGAKARVRSFERFDPDALARGWISLLIETAETCLERPLRSNKSL